MVTAQREEQEVKRVRLIDGEELYGIVKLHDVDVVRSSRTASWLLDQILFDIHESPTIATEDVPRKTAHLVLDRYGIIKCDACGKCVAIGGKRTLHNERRDNNYCPGCGAKLVGDDDGTE